MTDIFSENTQRNKKDYSLYTIPLILLLLLLTFTFLYYLYFTENTSSEVAGTSKQNIFKPDFQNSQYRKSNTGGDTNYSGKVNVPDAKLDKYEVVFMAAANNSDKLATTFITPLAKDLPPKKIKKADGSSVMHFDISGNKAAFLEINSKELRDGKKDYLAVRFKVDNNFKDKSVLDAREIPVKNSDKRVYYRNLDLNSKGDVLLFNALPVSYEGKRVPHLAKQWNIYILDIESGGMRFLKRGLYPHWVSNSAFIYLGDKGLYIYDVENDFERLLYTAPNNALASSDMYVNVSEDMKYLIWSFPMLRYNMLYQITDSKIGVLKPIIKIRGDSAVLPAFSQDSRLLAFVSIPDYDKYAQSGPNSTASYFKVYDVLKQRFIQTPLSSENLNSGNDMSTFQLSSIIIK